MSKDIARKGSSGTNAASNADKKDLPPARSLPGDPDWRIVDGDLNEGFYPPSDLLSLTLADDLAHALGLAWTRRNPVWGPTALDRIRGLQHTLMNKALAQAQEERSVTLQAVKCLEIAVNLRLRLEEGLHIEQVIANVKQNQSPTAQPSATQPATPSA